MCHSFNHEFMMLLGILGCGHAGSFGQSPQLVTTASTTQWEGGSKWHGMQ